MHSSFNHLLFKRLSLLILMSIFATCAIFAHAKDLSPAQKTLANKNLVSIHNAWVRPTSAGQDVGAAYMTLTSQKDMALVHIVSDVTQSIEIHSMSMENGIMKMRMLDTLPLTAGKPYKLEPGGFHLMLFDLKKPLTVGEQISFELTFENKDHVEFKQQIKATVKAMSNEADSNNDSNKHHH